MISSVMSGLEKYCYVEEFQGNILNPIILLLLFFFDKASLREKAE